MEFVKMTIDEAKKIAKKLVKLEENFMSDLKKFLQSDLKFNGGNYIRTTYKWKMT